MTKRILLVAALVPALIGAQTPVTPAASPIPSTLPVDRVAAIVGDQVVLWSDVLTTINQRRAAGMQLPADSAGQAALGKSVLSELIDEEILVQKAKEMKLEATESDVTAAADRQIKQARAQFQSDEEYRPSCARRGLVLRKSIAKV